VIAPWRGEEIRIAGGPGPGFDETAVTTLSRSVAWLRGKAVCQACATSAMLQLLVDLALPMARLVFSVQCSGSQLQCRYAGKIMATADAGQVL
jgi:hypothetical protein